jgi:hypothetical protein
MDHSEAAGMTVAEGSAVELLPTVRDASRALLFLTVPWSCPERNARLVFRAAASRLAEEYLNRGIRFFSMEEDDEATLTWLSSLGIPEFGGGYPRGAGGLLWLERGHAISSEITANSLGIGGIIARCLWLWGG